MNNNSPSGSTTADFLPRQPRQALQRSGLPPTVGSPLWLGLLGALVIAGMLLTFHHVVHGAVQQGELRHKATTAYAEATWRCNMLQGQSAGDACKAELNAVSAVAGLQMQATVLASQDDINLR